MIISSILIIGIAAILGFRLFTRNPLEGVWNSEDMNLTLTIQGNGTAQLQLPDETDTAAEMYYDIDTDIKTLTFHTKGDMADIRAQESDEMTETGILSTAAKTLEGTYDYSLEQGELTLTEREYGEQMVFEKE